MIAEQPSKENKTSGQEETKKPLENGADIGNERPEQGTEEVISEIEKQNKNFLPEAEQRIGSEAKALGVTPEELEESLKEQKIGAKLQEIQDKTDQLGEETKEKLAREKMNRRFEEERKSVPESIMEATSANVMVVRVRPDFNKLRDFLAENGYDLKEHPGRKGVPFQILADDIYEVDDLTFAVEMDSPVCQELMKKDLIETIFVVEDANEENLEGVEEMEKQNEFYSKGKDKYGQTVHKRGPYLVCEKKVPSQSAE